MKITIDGTLLVFDYSNQTITLDISKRITVYQISQLAIYLVQYLSFYISFENNSEGMGR